MSAETISFGHEAAICASDDELLRAVNGQLQAADAAGDVTVLCLGERLDDLLRAALGPLDAVTYLPTSGAAPRPAGVIRALGALVDAAATGQGRRPRFVFEVPQVAAANGWDRWRRYEAALSRIFAGRPGHTLCLYDRRLCAAGVLGDVERTHALVHNDAQGRRFAACDGEELLRGLPDPAPDPLRLGGPASALVDPTPVEGRRAVRLAARASAIGPGALDDLIIATSEAITNAAMHGIAPVTVQVWAAPDRMVVVVHDQGPGPADPFVGLVAQPRPGQLGGGLGLWMINQLADVAFSRAGGGFSVELVARRQD